MISTFSAQLLLWLLGIGSVGGLAAFAWKEMKDWIRQKEERDAQERLVEILKDQRDSPIDSVPAADGLWDDYKPPG
jgi:hypothetical protein